MLKKAGIAVAASAAALLALSPLALATEGKGGGNTDNHSQAGLVNVQDVVAQANVCDNNVNVLGIQVADLTGALGIVSGATTAEDNDTCSNASSN